MKFEELYAIDVSEKIEKKGGLSYLSWAYAWAEFKKVYPKATYQVDDFGGMFCSGNEQMGYMVRTSVAADELSHEMWLPVMDSRNKSILRPTTFDINKAIMRCLTKNLAMFGLGLYIYAGEDIPDDENRNENGNKPSVDKSTERNKETPHKANTEAWKLSKTEIVTKYKCDNAEAAITYYEKALGGRAFAEWDKDETALVREALQKRLDKKRAEETLRSIEGDLPFGEGVSDKGED